MCFTGQSNIFVNFQLSPPNSVTEKMRDLFIEQEKARYKLRLQHLTEKVSMNIVITCDNFLCLFGLTLVALHLNLFRIGPGSALLVLAMLILV